MDRSTDIFQLLDASSRSMAGLQIRESDVQVDKGRVAHAVDTGGRHLLLVPKEFGEPVLRDESSRGVTLAAADWVDGDELRSFVSLRCEIPSLLPTFAVLCDEVLEVLETDPSDPTATCRSVLERWRDLLGPRASKLLGENAVLGLLVELRFLERVVERNPADLRLWTGPDRARVDFTGKQACVEVKATTGRERFAVEIHGIRQLEPPEGKQLFLWAEQMERVPAGGDSLPAAVDRILSHNVDHHAFMTLLAQAGYQSGDRDGYLDIQFSRLSDRAFEVTEAFPRIVRDSFVDPTAADRVTAVRYTIDLTDPHDISGVVDGALPLVARLTG